MLDEFLNIPYAAIVNLWTVSTHSINIGVTSAWKYMSSMRKRWVDSTAIKKQVRKWLKPGLLIFGPGKKATL